MRIEHWVYTVPLRLRSLLRRGRVEDELDEELRYHLERQVEENVARGMTAEEARYAALRAMGGVEQHKESCRDARGTRLVEELVQDVGYGFRTLAKNRGFAAVAVLTLALGIGANTAVFSVVDAVFLQPLPYRDPERLVVVWEDATVAGYPRNDQSVANYADLRAGAELFEDMGAMWSTEYSLTGDGEPERISVQEVTANLLPLVGVEPALGRNFLPEEDRQGGPRAVLLSHGLWQRRYGGDPNVVGREVRLDDLPHTVVGVMPPGFQLLDEPAGAWVPIAFGPQHLANRGTHFLVVVGRLKPGVSVEQAQAEAQSIMERIGREHPQHVAGRGAALVPLREQVAGDVRQPLAVLAVAVGLVLLVACVNVGNLMLSRAASRTREIAVRAALGASRGRVLRQLLAESVPLALLGAGVGLLFAYWSLDFLRRLVPPEMRASVEPALDLRVLGFTLVVALAATVLFGLAPALRASKADLAEALRRGTARTGVSAGGRLRGALVVGQVSLAIALLVGASLLVQTLFLLVGQYSELQTERVLTMKTTLPQTAYDTHAKREAFFERVVERARSVPGVVAAGYTNALPLDYKGDANNFTPDGVALDPSVKTNANTRFVSERYLEALGVPLRRGRHFTEADVAGSRPVVIVNETMARQFWGGDDVVGRRLKLGGPTSPAPWATIVGVAADVRQDGVDEPARAEVYFLYRQTDYLEMFAPRTLAIRTGGDPETVAAAVRREIAAVDPNQPVSDVRTMSDILGEETATRRFGALLLGAFAAVALLLASIGIYGLLAQLVAQKRPEIGVRLALGATPRDVVGLVVGRGMKLVAVGSAAGLALSFALTRLMSGLLFGVSAADPLTLAGVPALLAAVALVACYVPARRAARVDPNVALRYE